ncbi:MAG: hypothetical protein BEU04_03450 [Marine Group III euryarchaeote CG-Bathy1]|uniref:Peptidase S8/S53 domain-containing protein n=1 Tax=Marine Group III euryarchaeote CG-Bathy1 TaxID=1889001 RepID=A0A1J5T1H9_9ARCH|nr:MAG: hypothetical protein BEU04_03450 [Marine Group III euryarchaeote CG-Bathy1]
MRKEIFVGLIMLLSLVPASSQAYPQFEPSYFDKDGDGIDDRLYPLIDKEEDLNIFLVFNQKPDETQLEELRVLGLEPDFVSKYIPTMIFYDLPYYYIPDLLHITDLKLIEWQSIYYPLLDTSVPGILARGSEEYGDGAAELGLTGEGINVAIIDTGVDNSGFGQAHESLDDMDDDPLTDDPKFIAGWQPYAYCVQEGDFNCPEDGSKDPDDRAGHGTHTASTAIGTAGETNYCDDNCSGVAPGARLIDVKVLSDLGAGGYLIEGLEWIIDNKDTDWEDDGPENDGVDVISMSLGSGGTDGSDQASQMTNAVVANGIVAVAATGNDGDQDIGSPAAADYAIAVGAMDNRNTILRDDDEYDSYSNYGPRQDDGDEDEWDEMKPDVMAPGTGITAAQEGSTSGESTQTGTSMACPHVAGVAALMLEFDESLRPTGNGGNSSDNYEVYDNPVQFAMRDFADRGFDPDNANNTHYANKTGWGYINAYDLFGSQEPDLEIRSVNVDPDEPRWGDELTINVTVRNRGLEDISSFSIRMRVDGMIYQTDSHGSVEARQAETLTYNWEPPEGNFTLKFELYGINPEDANSDNNEKEIEVGIGPAREDLKLKNLNLDPSNPEEGETVTLTAEVENIGTDNVTEYSITFYDGNEEIEEFENEETLGSGNSTTYETEWVATDGEHDLRAVARNDNDPNNDNNEYTREVNVGSGGNNNGGNQGEANFYLKDLDYQTPVVNEDTSVRVTVKNIGDASGTANVKLRVDGQDITQRNQDLDEGEEKMVEFIWRPDNSGDTTIEITAGDYSINEDVYVEDSKIAEIEMSPSQYEVDTSGTNVFQVTVKNLRSSSLDLDLRIDISNQILTAWIGTVPQTIDGNSEWNGELMITAKDNIDVGNYPLEVSIYRDGKWIDSAISDGILIVKSDTIEINLTPGSYFELSMDIFNPMSSGTTITVTAETPSGISVLYNNMPTYSEYVEGEGIRTVTVKITVDNVGAPAGNNEIEIKANGGSFAGMATVNVILPGGEEEGDEESMMMTIAIAVGVILIIGLAAYFYRRDDDEYEYYDDDEEYEEEW